MRAFSYERPTSVADAVALLAEHGPDARVLAGGTDLVIRLRDGSASPTVVVDVKRIPELDPAIREVDGWLVIGATTVMTEIAADVRIRRPVHRPGGGGGRGRLRPDPQPCDARGQPVQCVARGRHGARRC